MTKDEKERVQGCLNHLRNYLVNGCCHFNCGDSIRFESAINTIEKLVIGTENKT